MQNGFDKEAIQLCNAVEEKYDGEEVSLPFLKQIKLFQDLFLELYFVV